MQFIHVFLLFGLLGVLVPIVIQLLNRKNARRTPWGAMIFLLSSMQRRRRRVLLEDILLMACRCLLPALAALALARPFITPHSETPWVVVIPALLLAIALFGVSFALWRYPKWRFLSMVAALALGALVAVAVLFEHKLNLKRFGGGAEKDVALVVDGSSSMAMTGSDGKSNFDRAVEEAGKYIEQADARTAFSIILGGPVPEVLNPVPIADRRILRETLQQLRPAGGTMRAPAALTAAAVTLAAGNNAVKQIVVVGDGQAAGWDLASAGRWTTIRAIFSQLRTDPVVVWRTLPLPASIRDLAVSSVVPSREVVGTDREVGIRVTVLNAGTESVTPDSVTLRVGDRAETAKGIRQLEPGASQTFTFRHRFDKPGAAVLQATVSAHDDLPDDDTCEYVLPVLDTLRVLVVDGDASGSRLARGSTYLSLALRPEMADASDASGKAGFLLDTEVEDVSRTATRTDFSAYSVVALCNVAMLSDKTLAALAAHVRRGGGLLVLPGAKTRPAVWNAWALGAEQVLPLELDKWTVAAGAAEAVSVDPASFAHDLLRPFRVAGDLGTVAPMQRWRLKPGLSGKASVAASFSNGDPFLALKPFGRGVVALSAVPFDAVSSDLPSRFSFVPFVHEIAYHLARPVTPELNLAPSDGATLLLAPQLSSAGASSGLSAAYYPRPRLQGDPVVRVDRNVDFSWGGGSPLPAPFPADDFSVRWSGSLTARKSGLHEFKAEGDDEIWLELDGKRVSANGKPGSVRLVAGKTSAVRIEYAEKYQQAGAHLLWREPGEGGFRPVPPDVLAPASVAGFGQLVSVTGPNGLPFNAELVLDDLGTSLVVNRPLLPGHYVARAGSGGFPLSLGGARAPDGTVPFYVRAGTEESSMVAVSRDQADRLRDFIVLSLATKEEDVVKILHGSAFGSEIWRVFAIAVLVFLVAEVALARWISIQRRSGEETDVDFTNEGEMGKASFKEALRKIKKG